MPNNITAPRVPLTDPRTGLIHREWYRFFLSLYDLVLSGNSVSIADLQVGPMPSDNDDISKAIQAAQLAPATFDAQTIARGIQGLAVAPQDGVLSARLDALAKAVQGLLVAPVAMPSVAPIVVTATLDFPNTVAGACSDLTVTVPGAVSGDVVALGVPAASVPANGSYFAWVSAADTATVRFANNDLVTAYDPASGVFRVAVTRY